MAVIENNKPIDLSLFKTKSEIEMLQKFLKKNNYDLGAYGANKDGIDGKVGDYTRKAVDAYNASLAATAQKKDEVTMPTPPPAEAIPAVPPVTPAATAPVTTSVVSTSTPSSVEPSLGAQPGENNAQDVDEMDGGEIGGSTVTAQKTDPMESILYSLFQERRKQARKERTDELKLAAYNSLGNALRALGQPIGWLAGGATSAVINPDRRNYLDAFNRAVAYNNELSNIAQRETEYQINRAEYDRRKALEIDDYKQKQEIYKETQKEIIKAREDAAMATLREKVNLGGGQDLYSERLTNAVQGWIIHGVETPLDTYLNNIEKATPGYFGDKRPSKAVTKQIEEAADGAADAATGTATGTATGGAGKGATATQTQTGLTAEESAILAKWRSADLNGDGRITKDERKTLKSNGKAAPSAKDARRYEKAAKKKGTGSTAGSANTGSARSIMGK
jgi:hypothetical protein